MALVDCQRNYLVALLVLHKVFGDPRGRGAVGTAIELFVTWRLSIIQRMQGKTADAEMVEELFDSVLTSCAKCPGAELFSHLDDPFSINLTLINALFLF